MLMISLYKFILGFVNFADLLVKNKANLNIENKNGDTPLKLAKASGSWYFQT